MISTILYGRNDGYGYNLHKRAALSLNSIAHVLDHDDDEIIFVDYNTPNELPTFPESISDTLTDKCKSILRIIRVRPDYHQKFFGKTNLAALECQSRNIGSRRSNPNNRWVLSTNTDMIFCSKDERSLSDAAAALPDGFYHLPRFEVPEGFWERLPRSDPATVIRAMRDNGRRFHLNEIVLGAYDNIYDGPGDFQLFLRSDLFRIHGFDEEMILGWHADTNIARRMRILRGEVRSAAQVLAGYHCGHTRQATSLHTHGRSSNDYIRFIEQVKDAHLLNQSKNWGDPESEIEEIDLHSSDVYFNSISFAIPNIGPEESVTIYNNSSYQNVSYSTEHVLPHICDLLFNLPPKQKFLFFGDDAKLLLGIRNFLDSASKSPEFIFIAEVNSPSMEVIDGAGWEGSRRPFKEALEQFDVIIIQLPSADVTEEADRQVREHWCRSILTEVTRVERQAPPNRRRRVITVNAVHGVLETTVTAALAPVSMPFSTRLRQGFVVGTDQPSEVRSDDGGEMTLVRRVVSGLLCGSPPEGWERVAKEILDITATPEGLALLGLSLEGSVRVRSRAEAEIGLALMRVAEPPAAVGPRADSLNRLCSAKDWSDPDWNASAKVYFGPKVVAFGNRSRWTWERVSVANNLRFAINQRTLFPERIPSVLVVTAYPDYLVVPLGKDGYRLTYATLDEALGRADHSRKWKEILPEARAAQPYWPFGWSDGRPPDGFDAVVLMVPNWVGYHFDDVEHLFTQLSEDVKPNALLVAAMTVQIGAAESQEGLTFAEWRSLFHSDGVLGARGFEPVGEWDPRIPEDTALCFARPGSQDKPIPGLSLRDSLGGLTTSAVITAQWPELITPGLPQRRSAPPPDDEEVYARLGRDRPFVWQDKRRLQHAISGLAQARPLAGWEQYAYEIAAIAASSEPARLAYGLSTAKAGLVLKRATAALRTALSRVAAAPSRVTARARTETRLCSGADWNDQRWVKLADRFFPIEGESISAPDLESWERVSLLWNLKANLAHESRMPVLFVGPADERLLLALAELGIGAACVTVPELVSGFIPPLEDRSSGTNRRFWPWLRGQARNSAAAYEHIVLTRGVLEAPAEVLSRTLAVLSPKVSCDAKLHAALCVDLSDLAIDNAIGLSDWKNLYGQDGLLGGFGFRPVGLADYAVPLDTVIRAGDHKALPGQLARRDGHHTLTSGVTTASWPDLLGHGPGRRLKTPPNLNTWTSVLPEGVVPGRRVKPRERKFSGMA